MAEVKKPTETKTPTTPEVKPTEPTTQEAKDTKKYPKWMYAK